MSDKLPEPSSDLVRDIADAIGSHDIGVMISYEEVVDLAKFLARRLAAKGGVVSVERVSRDQIRQAIKSAHSDLKEWYPGTSYIESLVELLDKLQLRTSSLPTVMQPDKGGVPVDFKAPGSFEKYIPGFGRREEDCISLYESLPTVERVSRSEDRVGWWWFADNHEKTLKTYIGTEKPVEWAQPLVALTEDQLPAAQVSGVEEALTFEQLKEAFLRYNWKSEYMQAAIVVLRNVFTKQALARLGVGESNVCPYCSKPWADRGMVDMGPQIGFKLCDHIGHRGK